MMGAPVREPRIQLTGVQGEIPLRADERFFQHFD